MIDFNKLIVFLDAGKLGLFLLIYPFIWELISGADITTDFWNDYYLFVFGCIIGAIYLKIHQSFQKKG